MSVNWWTGEGILWGKQKDQTPQFVKAPEYPEADNSRALLWQKLNQFGNDSNYGGISPDWADIWSQAQQKVRDYFGGTATQPGVNAKIRANAARRGVSDSPATDAMLLRSNVEQGRQMTDLAQNEAINKAQFGENARQDWLSRVYNLSNEKPQGTWYTPQNTLPSWQEALTGVVGAGVNLGMAGATGGSNLWLQQLLKKEQQPQTTQNSILWT